MNFVSYIYIYLCVFLRCYHLFVFFYGILFKIDRAYTMTDIYIYMGRDRERNKPRGRIQSWGFIFSYFVPHEPAYYVVGVWRLKFALGV